MVRYIFRRRVPALYLVVSYWTVHCLTILPCVCPVFHQMLVDWIHEREALLWHSWKILKMDLCLGHMIKQCHVCKAKSWPLRHLFRWFERGAPKIHSCHITQWWMLKKTKNMIKIMILFLISKKNNFGKSQFVATIEITIHKKKKPFHISLEKRADHVSRKYPLPPHFCLLL